MVIEDCFNSNFDMICEDDSPREISCLIFKFENESEEKLFEILQA